MDFTDVPDDVRDFLARIIEEALDSGRDHLEWLAKNAHEPDRDRQRAETERSIELAIQAQAIFPIAEQTRKAEAQERAATLPGLTDKERRLVANVLEGAPTLTPEEALAQLRDAGM